MRWGAQREISERSIRELDGQEQEREAERQIRDEYVGWVDIICEVGTHNPYGLVTRGSLRLEGYLLGVAVKARKGQAPFNCVIRCGGRECGARFFMDRVIMSDLTTERDFLCFFGFQRNEFSNPRDRKEDEADFCVLLLEMVEKGIYRRVGCGPFFVVNRSWLERASHQEFSLI